MISKSSNWLLTDKNRTFMNSKGCSVKTEQPFSFYHLHLIKKVLDRLILDDQYISLENWKKEIIYLREEGKNWVALSSEVYNNKTTTQVFKISASRFFDKADNLLHKIKIAELGLSANNEVLIDAFSSFTKLDELKEDLKNLHILFNELKSQFQSLQ